MQIGSILNFQEWTRTANSSSRNLRKAEIFISIRSKVMSQILTVFARVLANFTLCTIFFKLSLPMFSIMADQLTVPFYYRTTLFLSKYYCQRLHDISFICYYTVNLKHIHHISQILMIRSDTFRAVCRLDHIFLRSVSGIFLTDCTITHFQL